MGNNVYSVYFFDVKNREEYGYTGGGFIGEEKYKNFMEELYNTKKDEIPNIISKYGQTIKKVVKDGFLLTHYCVNDGVISINWIFPTDLFNSPNYDSNTYYNLLYEYIHF